MAIDGFEVDLPDSAENAAEFGYAGSGTNRSAFPKARVVAVAECGTHAFLTAEIDAYKVGERTLAQRLYPRLRRDELLVADRGFYSYKGCSQGKPNTRHERILRPHAPRRSRRAAGCRNTCSSRADINRLKRGYAVRSIDAIAHSDQLPLRQTHAPNATGPIEPDGHHRTPSPGRSWSQPEPRS